MAPDLRRLVARLFQPATTAPPAEIRVDVRPLFLTKGCGSPLAAVLAAARALPVGGRLRVVAPFDPAPMRRVLLAEGFRGGPTEPRDGGCEILFTRIEPADRGALAAPARSRAAAASLDLRGLAPPAPMVEILRALEAAPDGGVVTARLDREPLHLYPELAARGWGWSLSGDDDGFTLRLTRESPK